MAERQIIAKYVEYEIVSDWYLSAFGGAMRSTITVNDRIESVIVFAMNVIFVLCFGISTYFLLVEKCMRHQADTFGPYIIDACLFLNRVVANKI